LGLRWEFFGGPTYPGAPEGNPWVSRLTYSGVWPDIGDFNWVTPRDGSDCACENDLNNFAPRIGLAYRLGEGTVIRAGGGIYYGEADYVSQEAGRFQVGPPNTLEFSDPQPRETSILIGQNGFPALPPPP